MTWTRTLSGPSSRSLRARPAVPSTDSTAASSSTTEVTLAWRVWVSAPCSTRTSTALPSSSATATTAAAATVACPRTPVGSRKWAFMRLLPSGAARCLPPSILPEPVPAAGASGGGVLPRRLRGRQLGDGRARVAAEEVVGQRQPDDLLPGRGDLTRQRARRVGQAVPAEEVLHLRGDLLVAVARQVREEVVLDLEAEVAGHEVHGLAAADVGRTEHLAQVPLAAGLADDGPALEGLDAFREVAAHDDRVGPQVADEVGRGVGGERVDERRPRQQRVDDVVLRHLVADLLQRHLGPRPEVGVLSALLGGEVLAQLEVVGRDAVLEEAGVDEVPQRLGQEHRVPALVLVDAHDAVAEVVVLADHVGEVVVQLVVRVLPLLGGGGVVPLPGGRVNLRVAHPVPLAVHDVVPDLHVLDDLGDREAGRADDPGGREHRHEQEGSAAELQLALGGDDLADVGRVVGSAGVDDGLPDGVELDTDLLDVLGGEVADRVVGLLLQDGHG